MHFWSPERPRNADGQPMYFDLATGMPIGPLQELGFYPKENGAWYVVVYLAVAPDEARLHTFEDHIDPATLLREYLDDPELVLAEYFKFRFNPRTQLPQPKREPSADTRLRDPKVLSIEDLDFGELNDHD